MTTLIDFTFTNKSIKAYFDGDDTYIPSSELIYLHSHPLIKPSFLTEIDKRIMECTEFMLKVNMKGRVLDTFIESTKKIGAELPNLTQQNAPIVLKELRTVYKLCNQLLG